MNTSEYVGNAVALVVKAALVASIAHADQRRKDEKQTPYINHSLEVAELVSIYVAGNKDVVIAALLHDVIEDTKMGDDVKSFGFTVFDYVKEVTDDKSMPKVQRKKLQVAHAKNLSDGATAIRIADKISNVRSLIDSAPVGWSKDMKDGYVVWAIAVVRQLQGRHCDLIDVFNCACIRCGVDPHMSDGKLEERLNAYYALLEKE